MLAYWPIYIVLIVILDSEIIPFVIAWRAGIMVGLANVRHNDQAAKEEMLKYFAEWKETKYKPPNL